METVIFVLSAVIIAGAIEWRHQWLDHRAKVNSLSQQIVLQGKELHRLIDEEILRKAAIERQRKPSKESVFDAGEQTPNQLLSRMAYIPVARRRAQAERLSLGPQNHDEKVRENNTRAIESAG
jgi:hypothetical protein